MKYLSVAIVFLAVFLISSVSYAEILTEDFFPDCVNSQAMYKVSASLAGLGSRENSILIRVRWSDEAGRHMMDAGNEYFDYYAINMIIKKIVDKYGIQDQVFYIRMNKCEMA